MINKRLVNGFIGVMRRFHQHMKCMEGMKVSMPQMTVLKILYEEGNLSVSQIAQMLYITKASASVMINKLAQEGYISKKKSDTDHRQHLLCLSNKGTKILEHAKEKMIVCSNDVFSHLTSAEKEQFVILLEKVGR